MVQACKSHDSARNSGRRVSNTWATCPQDGDNISKEMLIPDDIHRSHDRSIKASSQELSIEEEPASYQLVGEVTAHQGF